MAALKLIAYLAFGVLFLSMSFTLYSQYQRAEAERRFLTQVGELAESVNEVGRQDVGTRFPPLSITVPSDCRLLFENGFIVARIGERRENFPVDVPLIASPLSAGNHELVLIKEREGVKIV
jgi:hypothetical protein